MVCFKIYDLLSCLCGIMKLGRVTHSNILHLMVNNVTHNSHRAHRYQSRGIFSMLKLNLKPTGGKMAFLMEDGDHLIWGWERADQRYFSVALLALSIWNGDLDGNAVASTGNLVQALVPVKWLGLSVTPCPSVFIWPNTDFPFALRSFFSAGNHTVIGWQRRWHPKSTTE